MRSCISIDSCGCECICLNTDSEESCRYISTAVDTVKDIDIAIDTCVYEVKER